MRELGKLSFRGHSHPVSSVVVSSNGNMLVSGGEDHKVKTIPRPKNTSPIVRVSTREEACS